MDLPEKGPVKRGTVQKAPTRKEDPALHRDAARYEKEHWHVVPQHKHERYPRFGNKKVYDKNLEAIFGKRSLKDVSRRSGSSRTHYK